MLEPSLKKMSYLFSPTPDMTRASLIIPNPHQEEPYYLHDRVYMGIGENDIQSSSYRNMIVVPEWCKDNQFIKSGYRECYHGIGYYMKSIFQYHNETLNIWTHLLATIGYFVFFIYSLSDPTIRHTVDTYVVQAVVFYMLLASSITCFFWSFVMHTFFPISEPVCHWLQRADYMGIFFNITCVYIAFVYFAFYTQVQLQLQYTCFILFVSLLFALGFVIKRGCVKPGEFKWRVSGLAVYGATIIVPIVHRLTASFDNDDYFLMELRFFLGATLLFLCGIGLYVTKFPERLYPDGRFDKLCNSHTLFHLFTLGGNILCTIGIWRTLYSESLDSHL
jgi:adiponectin receptor